MKEWYDVIEKSKDGSQPSIYIIDDNLTTNGSKQNIKKYPRSAKRGQYWLGEAFPGIYFTQREAECIYHLTRGLTIVAAAKLLNLSPRTVEFYLKNIKAKLKVKTKSQLVQLLHEIDYVSKLCKELKLGPS